jgi:rhamnosyltransferase
MDVSVVIRTLNESRWLPELLEGIKRQSLDGLSVETIIVDSGSTDETLKIAQAYDCRILHIAKERFTFGRALNVGCERAQGKALAFISGHCLPANDQWITKLTAPLWDGAAAYAYGRQEAHKVSKFSEIQLFRQFYPLESKIPQEGFFCNNANAALLRSIWSEHPFDEELTGLEDMAMGKRITQAGHKVAYIADASVYHIHQETWSQVRRRYEREAIALQSIMPDVHVHLWDVARYFAAGVALDWREALKQRLFTEKAIESVQFRWAQYWGTYRGNHEHRLLSRDRKESYFYPR